MTSNYAFALVSLPLLGAALAFVAKALPVKKATVILETLGALVGLVVPLGVLAISCPAIYAGQVVEGTMGHWHAAVGISYRFDGLAWAINALGYILGLVAWIYSRGAGPHGPAFTALFLIQTAALAATALTTDIFNLFVCLEVMGMASYVLVAQNGKPGAFLASFSYLMVSATAMVFFLLGIYGLYRLTGSLSYEGIAAGLASLPQEGGITAQVSIAVIVGAVAIRVAVMPVYGWLPDAHAQAPHAVSAVLSGVLIKTPLFALSRILVLLPAGALAGQLMGYAGAITALLAVIIALAQKDAKRLLAYHTVSQIGYVVAAWGAAIHLGPTSPAGAMLMAAAFLHAFFHALFKGLLFLSVGTVVDYTGQRNVYRLRAAGTILRRVGEKIPISLVTFMVGALSISAIPPMNGFVSKTILSSGLKGRVEYYLLIAAAVGTVASLVKLSRIFWPTKKHLPQEILSPHTPQTGLHWRGLAQAILAIFCLVGGLAGANLYGLILNIFSPGLGMGPGYEASSLAVPVIYRLPEILSSLGIVAGGVVLFLITGTKPMAALLHGIQTRERTFQGLFVAFVLGTLALAWWML